MTNPIPDKPSVTCGQDTDDGPCNGHFQHDGPCRRAPFAGWRLGSPRILEPR